MASWRWGIGGAAIVIGVAGCAAGGLPALAEAPPQPSAEAVAPLPRDPDQPQRLPDWLLRHQSADGGWDPAALVHRCPEPIACRGVGQPGEQVAVTALVLSAYQAMVPGVDTPPWLLDSVTRGTRWLLSRQDADGGFAEGGARPHRTQALATLALAHFATVLEEPGTREGAARAAERLISLRRPDGSWAEGPEANAGDPETTAWAVEAFRVRMEAGGEVPEAVFADALAWVVSRTDSVTGRTGPRPPSLPTFRHHTGEPERGPEMETAFGLWIRRACGEIPGEEGPYAAGLTLLLEAPPTSSGPRSDPAYVHAGTRAVHDIRGGPLEKAWKEWSRGVMDAVLKRQRIHRFMCEYGSFDPPRDTFPGGRIEATAWGEHTLILYYRCARCFCDGLSHRTHAEGTAPGK